MPKNNIFSQLGFTLLEALVVIAIIAILSISYIITLRPDTIELMRMDTTRLAADIRYARSMATSRVAYNGSYPSYGYGILFKNGDLTRNIKSQYQIYAGISDYQIVVLKTVVLSDEDFLLIDPNNPGGIDAAIGDRSDKRFSFKTDNDVRVYDLTASSEGDYQIQIYYTTDAGVYFKNTINIGRKTEDNFVWSNLSIIYDTNTPTCGNGIIEVTEGCERTDINGTLVNADCIPAGNGTASCTEDYCGNGIIMGTETCEAGICIDIDPVTGVCKKSQICREFWCYACGSIGSCTFLDSGGAVIPSDCCRTGATMPHPKTCVNCQISPNPCVNSCPEEFADPNP